VSAKAAQVRLRIAHLADLADGDVIVATAGERELAVYRIAGRVYASDNLCTHGGGRLCEGFLEGYSIECPLHQGAFDVRDGSPVRFPAEEPLATYAIEIDGGEIYVLLPIGTGSDAE
jgi:naphthalene 1,2-dioxygenase system ferredoxin subunit